MKVTTDSCLFGAYIASKLQSRHSSTPSVLDIGTGTGLLSLMLAQKNKDLSIDAIEIDDAAYEQGKNNFALSPWLNQLTILQGDIKQFAEEKKYDFLICNPPFYENELKGSDPKKNKAHHDEGLLLCDLLPIIKQRLKEKGQFFLLLPYKRKTELLEQLQLQQLQIEEIFSIKQTTAHPFFRCIVTGSNHSQQEVPILEKEIAIKDEQQQYTADFITLLKDYYLFL